MKALDAGKSVKLTTKYIHLINAYLAQDCATLFVLQLIHVIHLEGKSSKTDLVLHWATNF